MAEPDYTLLPALLRDIAQRMQNNGDYLYDVDILRFAADRMDALVDALAAARHSTPEEGATDE